MPNYEKMWNELKNRIQNNVKDLESDKQKLKDPIDIIDCNSRIIKDNEVLLAMCELEIEEYKNE